MGKFIYLFRDADKRERIIGIIALVLASVAFIMLSVSSNSAINRPIEEYNIMTAFTSEEESGLFDELALERINQLKEAIKNNDREFIRETEEKVGMSAGDFLKRLEKPSLKTMTIFCNWAYEEDLAIGYKFFIFVISLYAVILGGFILLGVLFMKGGFAIASLILSPLYFAFFVGNTWFFVYAITCILFAIFAKKFKKAYREYYDD